jgi:ATP-dependent helicase/nuclease subunit B
MPHRTPHPLAEQLAATDAPVVLLTGPAASGKTSALLELASQRPAALLLPNAATARSLSLPAEPAQATRTWTFATLCDRVGLAAGDRMTAIRPFDRRLLLRRIVEDQRDHLTVLADVAATPGFLLALDRAIGELKRAAVEPRALLDIVEPRGKGRDLARLYDAYQHALLATDRYDTEGRFWRTRQLLADKPDLAGKALAEIDTLLVDGFADFTPTQLAILALLRPAMSQLAITLPLDADGRDRMWQWTARTAQAVRDTFPGLTELATTAGPADSLAIGALAGRVFDFHTDQLPLPPGLDVIATAGAEAEVIAVARRVKQLLHDGTDPARIAILARHLDEIRPTIERVFGEFDIPLAPAAYVLADVPVVRFLLHLAELPELNFAFPAVLRVLNSSYFHPAALGPFDETTAIHAETLIRHGNVLDGRHAPARAAAALADRAAQPVDDQTPPDPHQPTAADFTRAAELLDALYALAERCTTSADLPELIDRLDLTTTCCEQTSAERIARDLRALETCRQLAPHEPAPWAHLVEALGEVTLPGPRSDQAAAVLSVLDARARRWDHVFLLGTSEGQFPAPLAETALPGEADREAWARHNLPLDLRSDLTAREMLLFYLAATRAEKTFTATYQHATASGGAAAPGAFLEALLAPAGGLATLSEAGRLETIPPGPTDPPPEQIATANEALRAGLTSLGQTSILPALLVRRADVLTRSAAGLWTLHRRWAGGEWNEYDGRLSEPALLESLAERFDRTVFSAGRLNDFAKCPWKYFARELLSLEPLVQPQRTLEPQNRGIYIHNALYRTMTILAGQHGRPVPLAELTADDLAAALDQAEHESADRLPESQIAFPLLWARQQQTMHLQMLSYLQAQQAHPFQPRPSHFELGFGIDPDRVDWMDPASTTEPVEIKTSAGTIHLAGKIDRIDHVATDIASGALLVDYKSGSSPSRASIADARDVQMSLYLAVADTLLDEPCIGGAYHALRDGKETTFAEVKLYRNTPRADEHYTADRQVALGRIGEMIQAIRDGRFDLEPATGACTSCDYRQSCHLSQARSDVKQARDGRASS